ncbi:MAG TPA: pantetheine-phosphate adenylyltransferase [Sphingobacteriaceae bacterium]
MKIALFPGSFDPVTKAHVDILRRSVSLFDQVIVGIGINSNKVALLDIETRKKMLEAIFKGDPKIEVRTYEGLTVDYAKKIGAAYIIRGIRTVADFEYEKGIAHINHALVPEIESIFILSKPGYSSISSTVVRDILRNKGDVRKFVPEEAMPFL